MQIANNHIQKFLNRVIFGTDTPLGRGFDLTLLCFILLSVLVVIIDSVESISAQFKQQFVILEWFFTIIFTIEYLARIYCSTNRKAYMKSFYGIVDLLAILPTYLTLLFTGAHFLIVIRLLRVLRIFRIMKMMQFIDDAGILANALRLASRKISIFFFAVLVLVTIFGALMYAIEGEQSGFTSIPKGIYWAIVTVTTVGYGDISPQTPAGQLIAALAMLTGYAILAIPTGIIGSEIAQEMKTKRKSNYCKNCEHGGHEIDARFCRFCGSELPNNFIP